MKKVKQLDPFFKGLVIIFGLVISLSVGMKLIGMNPLGSENPYDSGFALGNLITPLIFGLFGYLIYKKFTKKR